MAEPGANMDALMTKMDRLQTQIEAADGWELERQLERAMDALRCPPGNPPSAKPHLSVHWHPGSRSASQHHLTEMRHCRVRVAAVQAAVKCLGMKQVRQRWTNCQEVSADAWPLRAHCCPSQTSCYWMSPPTTW